MHLKLKELHSNADTNKQLKESTRALCRVKFSTAEVKRMFPWTLTSNYYTILSLQVAFTGIMSQGGGLLMIASLKE